MSIISQNVYILLCQFMDCHNCKVKMFKFDPPISSIVLPNLTVENENDDVHVYKCLEEFFKEKSSSNNDL